MRAKRLLTTAVLTAALAAPAAASADRPDRNVPVSPEYAAIVAQDYWAKRGVTIPCDVTITRITRAEMPAARALWGSDMTSLWDIPSCSIQITPVVWRDRFDIADGPFEFCYQVQYGMGYLAGRGDLAERIRSAPWACDTSREVRRRFLRRWETKWGRSEAERNQHHAEALE